MTRKLLFALFVVFLIAASPSEFYGAENQEMASDYVSKIQNEISSDIADLRASLETELEGMSLESADISRRIQELTALTESASDDMTAWGYTPEQRDLRTRVLSELIIAYSAYNALIQGTGVLTSAAQQTISDDILSLGKVASPDINTSDSLRQEISKVSQGLDVQVFYLQSKISKLRLDLNEAKSLRTRLEEAQKGGEAVELPRTYVLELENAKINAALSRLQVRAQKTAFDKNVDVIRRLRRRLADIQEKYSFSKELLDSNIKKLQSKLSELMSELDAARKSLDTANKSLSRARTSLAKASSENFSNASITYKSRSALSAYWEYTVSMIEDEISFNREAQEIWRNRYKIFHEQLSGEEIWKLREHSAGRIQDLQRQLDGVRNLEAEVIRQIDDNQVQLSEVKTPAAQQGLLQTIENQRKIISDIFNRYESLIPNAIFLQQRLNDEASDSMSAIRLAEKVSSFSYDTVMNFLNTELWKGEGYSVTVSKLTIAILVFLSSFFLSSWGSNWIKRRMLRRAKASVTAANGVQRIVFYILWIAFALTALNIVKIPLTAFAFMGGAIALGIGFGMQNIFNNLISGFIVIFSRPFKVKDIVDVAGTQGTVEDIGSRSTTIKTWDGLDVILPNRYFLENSVINWTGSDLRKREVLEIGVSYDSDTRQVEKLLLDVAKDHSSILKNPASFVIFSDFGDNALIFRLYYWIDLSQATGMKVSSDLRHHIAAVFSREGIDIPYPQRVIHFAKDAAAEDITEEKQEEKEKEKDKEKETKDDGKLEK